MTPLLFFSLFSFHGQQVGAVVFAGTWRDGLGYSRLWFGSASAATLLPIRIIWIAKLMKIMGKCARMLANSCWCCENWLSMPSRACLPPGGICLPAMWRSPSECVAFAIQVCGVRRALMWRLPSGLLSLSSLFLVLISAWYDSMSFLGVCPARSLGSWYLLGFLPLSA